MTTTQTQGRGLRLTGHHNRCFPLVVAALLVRRARPAFDDDRAGHESVLTAVVCERAHCSEGVRKGLAGRQVRRGHERGGIADDGVDGAVRVGPRHRCAGDDGGRLGREGVALDGDAHHGGHGARVRRWCRGVGVRAGREEERRHTQAGKDARQARMSAQESMSLSSDGTAQAAAPSDRRVRPVTGRRRGLLLRTRATIT